jgi:hypothetical protein
MKSIKISHDVWIDREAKVWSIYGPEGTTGGWELLPKGTVVTSESEWADWLCVEEYIVPKASTLSGWAKENAKAYAEKQKRLSDQRKKQKR